MIAPLRTMSFRKWPAKKRQVAPERAPEEVLNKEYRSRLRLRESFSSCNSKSSEQKLFPTQPAGPRLFPASQRFDQPRHLTTLQPTRLFQWYDSKLKLHITSSTVKFYTPISIVSNVNTELRRFRHTQQFCEDKSYSNSQMRHNLHGRNIARIPTGKIHASWKSRYI